MEKLSFFYDMLLCKHSAVQVNNFQKIIFVYHFIKEFEVEILHDSAAMHNFRSNFFDKLVNKTVFLEIMNL